MLIVFQFPFADFRKIFAPDNELQLLRPNWQLPEVDEDFVKCFGMVRERRSGAIPGWIGEGRVCDANRSLSFSDGVTSRYWGFDPFQTWSIRKHLFSDGGALAKLEIAVRIKPKQRDKKGFVPISALVSDIASAEITSRFGNHAYEGSLANAGKFLARKYAYATVPVENRISTLSDELVRAGRPVAYIEQAGGGFSSIPAFANTFSLGSTYAATARGLKQNSRAKLHLANWSESVDGRTIPSFYLLARKDFSRIDARAIRAAVLRLWSEKEVLESVMRRLMQTDVTAHGSGIDSDKLQKYINQSLRRLRGSSKILADIVGERAFSFAHSAFEHFRGTEVDNLVDQILRLKMRSNIERKVLNALDEAEEYRIEAKARELPSGAKFMLRELTQGDESETALQSASIKSTKHILSEWGKLVSQHPAITGAYVFGSLVNKGGALFNRSSDIDVLMLIASEKLNARDRVKFLDELVEQKIELEQRLQPYLLRSELYNHEPVVSLLPIYTIDREFTIHKDGKSNVLTTGPFLDILTGETTTTIPGLAGRELISDDRSLFQDLQKRRWSYLARTGDGSWPVQWKRHQFAPKSVKRIFAKAFSVGKDIPTNIDLDFGMQALTREVLKETGGYPELTSAVLQSDNDLGPLRPEIDPKHELLMYEIAALEAEMKLGC